MTGNFSVWILSDLRFIHNHGYPSSLSDGIPFWQLQLLFLQAYGWLQTPARDGVNSSSFSTPPSGSPSVLALLFPSIFTRFYPFSPFTFIFVNVIIRVFISHVGPQSLLKISIFWVHYWTTSRSRLSHNEWLFVSSYMDVLCRYWSVGVLSFFCHVNIKPWMVEFTFKF